MSTKRSPWQRLRRVFLWAIIVSFSLAALAGIAVLLGAELGETGGRVILSTVTVGAFGLAMLCCGAVLDRPERMVGAVGIAISALSLLFSLVLIWAYEDWDWRAAQILFSGITLTAALSFVSLLVVMTRHRDQLIRVLLPITLALFALGTALILWAVWEGPGIDTEFFGRMTGIVLILVVLSGVTTPILSLLRGRSDESTTPPIEREHPETQSAGAPLAPEKGHIDGATIAALEARARQEGISVAELVAPVLRD